MFKPDKKTGRAALVPELNAELPEYISKCGDRNVGDIQANARGLHWYMVVGIDRQNKKVCSSRSARTFLTIL